jgi:hypothetical protein
MNHHIPEASKSGGGLHHCMHGNVLGTVGCDAYKGLGFNMAKQTAIVNTSVAVLAPVSNLCHWVKGLSVRECFENLGL